MSVPQEPYSRDEARSLVDRTHPQRYRVLDYLLGGKDNYAVDRQFVDSALEVARDGLKVAQDHRDWLERVMAFMATEGIQQYVVVGAGFPTTLGIHVIAQWIDPESRVVYVTGDVIVWTHLMAFIEPSTGAGVVSAIRAESTDIGMWDAPGLLDTIDLKEPVGVLFQGLSFIADDAAAATMTALYERLAVGGILAVANVSADTDWGVSGAISELYKAAGMPLYFRTDDEVRRLSPGELVGGVERLDEWQPWCEVAHDARSVRVVGAVTRKVAPVS